MTYLNQTDKIYAQSLLELDLDNQTVLKEMSQAEEVFKSSKELMNILVNPAINNRDKEEITEAVFKDKINEKIYKFIKILVEKNRISRFSEILQCYKEKYNSLNNIKNVEIISAVELDTDYKQKILTALENKLQKNITAEWKTDKDIIGGLVYKIGNTVIDASLKHKLESFNKIMK